MLIEKLKKQLFFKKLVVSYSIVFLAIITVLIFIFYFYIQSSVVKLANLNQQEFTSQILKLTENYIDELDKITYQVMTNQTIINKYAQLQNDKNQTNHFKTNVLDDIEISTILTNVKRNSSSVVSITVYNQYSDFTYSGSNVNTKDIKSYLLNENIQQKMNIIKSFKDISLIIFPSQQKWSQYNNSECITAVRPIMNIYSNEVYGIVEVQADINYLENLVKLQEVTNINLKILDKNKNIIITQNNQEKNTYITNKLSDNYGFTVELAQSKKEVFRQYKPVFYSFIILCFVCALIMIQIIILISKKISKPIVKLTESVNGIGLGTINDVLTPENAIDEVKELDIVFNSMISKLKISIKQEQQAMLYALQSQIEPHFLYNTLSVISAVALENEDEKVVTMCTNLSSMLRYASMFDKKSVTVKEEINYVRYYLELMKERYDEYLEYSIEVEDGMQDMKLPRLIIQPLTENCFKHAFLSIEPPYYINIRVYKDEKNWYIEVCDNGIGVFDITKQELYKQIKNKTVNDYSSTNINGMEIGGLGLISSVLRLNLFLSKEINCEIKDNNPRGTIIVLSGEVVEND